ncbi:MAG: HAD hydrolase-like protein [Firmicutes bacterium]|nr:HAD hydrolase-like protein [Bacillota bacterium]
MAKTANFLNGYNTVLFDMDGVITSEQRYWDAAALAIYEHLNSNIDVDFAMENKDDIRKDIFCNDKTVHYLKNIGVNSNWDVAYVILSAALIIGAKDGFEAVFKYLKNLNLTAPALYDHIGKKSPLGKRGGKGYHRLVLTFQEWYLGDEMFLEKWHEKPQLKGKKGLLDCEQPVIPIDDIKNVLKTLFDHGISLGIGTGRVDFETKLPLGQWDISKYFDENKIITYTEVLKSEKETGISPLAKPHEYTFLKGMLGKDFDDKKILGGFYDKTATKKTLVIGDAGADIFSAKAAGMDFAAVLTGISGRKAKDYFLANGADYILNDITGLIEGIETSNSGKDNCCNAFDKGVCRQA